MRHSIGGGIFHPKTTGVGTHNARIRAGVALFCPQPRLPDGSSSGFRLLPTPVPCDIRHATRRPTSPLPLSTRRLPPLDQSAVGFPDLLDIRGPQLLCQTVEIQDPVALAQTGHPAGNQCNPSGLRPLAPFAIPGQLSTQNCRSLFPLSLAVYPSPRLTSHFPDSSTPQFPYHHFRATRDTRHSSPETPPAATTPARTMFMSTYARQFHRCSPVSTAVQRNLPSQNSPRRPFLWLYCPAVHPAAGRLIALTGSWASAWITTWTWLKVTQFCVVCRSSLTHNSQLTTTNCLFPLRIRNHPPQNRV